MLGVLLAAALALFFMAPDSAAHGRNTDVRIGVLANKGKAAALERWVATAEYLNRRVAGHSFVIVPLSFSQVEGATGSASIDFLLTNSSNYVEMEELHGAGRILTLMDSGIKVFGGVIFCRADRDDLRSVEDLRGKSFIAADERSLGGWRAAWREINESGLDPFKDFSKLLFAGSHTGVVKAVARGDIDAGTVRTDTLERMAKDGSIDPGAFRIINERKYYGFPYRVSTRLYPEWPLAKLRHTPDDLAKKVAIALLEMPAGSRAALDAGIGGWTIALDYHPVTELMRELRIGPYEDYGKVTLSGVFQAYGHWMLLGALVFVFMTVGMICIWKLNRRLEEANDRLGAEIAERTRTEGELSDALSQVRTLGGLLPICSACKRIRDDKGYWNQIEAYISDHSEAQFSHGICPECAERLYPRRSRPG